MIKTADWITLSFDIGNGAAEFIKKFTTEKKAVSAMLTITAIGVYDAYLNGKRIGDFILAPGCMAYNKRLQYQTYNILDMLGKYNEIVITAGKSCHRSRMSENRPEINTKSCAVIG